MVGANLRDGVSNADIVLTARVMHGQLLPLDVQGKEVRITTKMLSRSLHSFSQNIPQPLTLGNLLNHRQHSFRVAEAEIESICILQTD